MTNNDSNDNTGNAGYVHDPEALREREDTDTDTDIDIDTGTTDTDIETTTDTDENEDNGPRTTKAYLNADRPNEQEFGRRGWALVAMLFVAWVVVPATILYLPQARPAISSLGLTYQDAYLALPLVPALLLGAMAVWVAVDNPRRE